MACIAHDQLQAPARRAEDRTFFGPSTNACLLACACLVDSCAAVADPLTNAGWFVLMYAAWIAIKLWTYSDVGPSRSRRSSETTSMS